jgi:hypothetical protein
LSVYEDIMYLSLFGSLNISRCCTYCTKWLSHAFGDAVQKLQMMCNWSVWTTVVFTLHTVQWVWKNSIVSTLGTMPRGPPPTPQR